MICPKCNGKVVDKDILDIVAIGGAFICPICGYIHENKIYYSCKVCEKRSEYESDFIKFDKRVYVCEECFLKLWKSKED